VYFTGGFGRIVRQGDKAYALFRSCI
jgi:hypothetical protein